MLCFRNAVVMIATLVLVLWLIVGDLLGRSATLEVTCPNPEGCFRLIEQTLAGAPPGATVRIGRGLYYEKPFVIDKNLSLVGEEAPEIRFVDPGVGIRILLPQIQTQSMTVTLEGLTISATQNGSSERKGSVGLGILGVPLERISESRTEPDRLQVILRDVKINSFMGIRVEGAMLHLEDSKIDAVAAGVYSIAAILHIEESFVRVERVREEDPFRGGVPVVGIGLQYSQLTLQDSWIIGGVFGVALGTNDEAVLVGNSIEGAIIGVFVTDRARVELRENRFWRNQKFGVALPLPGCASRPQGFGGTVTGVGNEFEGNGQDLCPREYAWPEGFVASTSGDASGPQPPLQGDLLAELEGRSASGTDEDIREGIPFPSSLRFSVRAVLLSRPEVFAPGLELEVRLNLPSRGTLLARAASLANGWAFAVGIQPSRLPWQTLVVLFAWERGERESESEGNRLPLQPGVGLRSELYLEAPLNAQGSAVYFTELGLSLPILGHPLQPVYRAGFALRF